MAAAMKATAADFGQEVASMMTTPAKSRRKEAPVVSRRRSRKPDSPFRDRRLLTTGASFLLLLAGVVIMLATSWPKSAAVPFMAAAIVVGGSSMARNGLFTVLRTRNVDMNVLMTVAVVGAAAMKATAADFGQEVASMMTTPAKSRRKEAPVVSRRRSRKGESGFRDRRLCRFSSSVWTPYPRLRTSSRTSCRDISAHLNSRKSRPEAKFTVASMTPWCREAARSTERAQSTQSMFSRTKVWWQ